MRWEEDKTPRLVLYHRIRPFLIRGFNKFTDPKGELVRKNSPNVIKDIGGRFIDVRTIDIPLDDIISASAGTNYRDKYNFIEIQFDQSLTSYFKNVFIKARSQAADEPAFSREGFRPMMVTSRYLPANVADKDADPWDITQWKFLLREWYFNTHVLLNGGITIIGQNNYIQVGDNIQFDSRAINFSQNLSTDAVKSGKIVGDNPIKILAHVEAVNHTFTVGPNGERRFVTTISFVRGMIVKGEDRRPAPGALHGRIDINVKDLILSDEKNRANVFASSTENDPDPKKLDGR
jgi:hypothetical protein